MLRPAWRAFAYAASLRPLTEIAQLIRSVKPDIRRYLKSKDATLLTRITQRLHTNTYLKQVVWDERSLSLCMRILSVSSDYTNELLFMLVKPKDILIQPNNLCGPDLIGYIGKCNLI